MAAEVKSNGNGESLNRTIYFSGSFDEEKAKNTVSQLIKYEQSDPLKDILIYIDSYGGNLDSFIAIHEAIQMCRCDVATLCIGKAMSAGQMLLISGAKGKRFITPNSRVLMHSLSCYTFGTIHQVDNDVTEYKRAQDLLEKLVKRYTKMNLADIRSAMSKDTFLDPKECLKMGIVDHIVNKPQDLYSKVKL